MSQRIPDAEVPAEIRLVNEFLNTLDLERFGEHAAKPEETREGLRDPHDLKMWLVERGLLGKEEVVTEEDRRLAVELRNTLRTAVATNSGAMASSELAGKALDLGQLPLTLRIGRDGRPELGSGSGPRGALAKILADVAVAASKGTWDRLKICSADDCQWAYFDHSRSRTSRWCAMETCGNRHKTRRYRQRRGRGGGRQVTDQRS